MFLTHPKEARKTKNGSGRLAHLGLLASELLVGVDFRDHPRVVELLADPRFDCQLLYPPVPGSPAAALAPPGRVPVLFVIDGTWPCAKKVMKLSTNLHGLPRVGVPAGPPSAFLTKHQPDPACLATIEAVDRVLLERSRRGEETWTAESSERLLRPFHAMVRSSMEHAANPPANSYRRSGPFRPPEQRPGRTVTTSGRNIVFQG